MPPGNRDSTVYVGNLDERVTDKVLYEILVQVGRIVDLHIPLDKDTNRHKGFAFAEYETEEIADYAVRLFSGLVTLYNRTLRFGISGQDKSSQKVSTHILPMNSLPSLSSHPPQLNYTGNSQRSSRNYAQPELSPLGMVQPNGYRSSIIGNTPDYSRRVFGAALDSVSHSSHRPYEWKNPNVYPSN